MIKLTPEETSLLENYSEDDYKYLFDESCFDAIQLDSDVKDDSNHKKLVLSAKIGKFLLEKIHAIEDDLTQAKNIINLRDQEINFLKSKLSANEAFIQSYSRTSGYEDDDNLSTLSSNENTSYQSDSGVLASLSCATFDSLSRKIRELEDENSRIKQQFLHMSVENRSGQLDEHDSSLVRDCLKQVKASNENSEKLREELNSKISAHNELYTQYLQLKSFKTELINKLEHLQTENELLKYQLKDAFTSKEQLTIHYKSLYDKYDEMMTLYNDCRKQLNVTRKSLKESIEANGNLEMSQSMSSLVASLDQDSTENFSPQIYPNASVNPFNQSLSSSIDKRSNSLANELIEAETLNKLEDIQRSNGLQDIQITSSPKVDKIPLRPKNLSKNTSRLRRLSLEEEETKAVSNVQLSPSHIFSSLSKESFDEKTPIQEFLPTSLLMKTSSAESLNFIHNETQTMVSNDYSKNKRKLLLVKPMSGSNVLRRWQELAKDSSLIHAMPSTSKGIIVRRRQIPVESIDQMLPKSDKSPWPAQFSKSLSKRHSLDNLASRSDNDKHFNQFNETTFNRRRKDKENPPSPQTFQSRAVTSSNNSGLLSSARIHAFFNAFLPGGQSTKANYPDASVNDENDKSEHSSSSDSSKNGKSLAFISTTSKGLLEACDLVKKPVMQSSSSQSEIHRLYDLSLQKKARSVNQQATMKSLSEVDDV